MADADKKFTKMKYIENIRGLNITDHKKFGAKAANLSKLIHHEFAVPRGFCISADGFRLFVKTNRILDDFDFYQMTEDQIDHTVQAIRSGEIPQRLKSEIEYALKQLMSGTDCFAVRSSGIFEDTPDMSFAGQYSTLLDVNTNGLFEAIKACWASFLSARIIEYLKYMHFPAKKFGGGIIVQEMIKSRISGVIFTHNPLNKKSDEFYIELVEGMCESLVSGSKTPGQIIINRKSGEVIHQQISFSKFSELQVKKVVQELVAGAQTIETLFKTPQDIEWTYSDKGLYYLQSRPITVLKSKKPKVTLWTDDNVGEVIPDIVTPLSWSILEPITNSGFSWLLKAIGIYRYPKEGLFKLIRGKVYLNKTRFDKTLERFYFRKRIDELKISDQRNHKHYLFVIKNSFQLIWSGLNIVILIFILPFKIKKHLREHSVRRNKIKNRQDSRKNILFGKCDLILKLNQQCMKIHMACTIFGEIFYQIIQKLLQEWNIKTDIITVNNLLLGLAETESAQSGIDLLKIAQKISTYNKINTIFIKKSADQIEKALRNVENGGIILKMIDDFLDQYGHCSLHEFELLFPRWNEDRMYIYDSLKSYLRTIHTFTPDKDKKERETKREAITEQCFAIIPSTYKKIILRWALKQAKQYCINRENLKQAFVKSHGLLKQYLMEIADGLRDKGIIRQTEDIFFITYGDLRAILFDPDEGPKWDKVIQQNRTERKKYLEIRHPKVIRQTGDQYDWDFAAEEPGNGHHFLKGIGCSDGNISAKARIICNPDNFHELEKGEILVAPSTNPGWTPLFVLAAGIITEVGGALSHGSIIAREYGIPYVANIQNATRIIKTGDRVLLNGSLGTVKIKKERMNGEGNK
jgi:phosphohistidine swiveling domain-containing protein